MAVMNSWAGRMRVQDSATKAGPFKRARGKIWALAVRERRKTTHTRGSAHILLRASCSDFRVSDQPAGIVDRDGPSAAYPALRPNHPPGAAEPEALISDTATATVRVTAARPVRTHGRDEFHCTESRSR